MSPLSATFAGRSVFVTGHTGFKGSWLCLWLERLGARVSGYALDPPTEPSHFDIARIADGLVADHRADVREGGAITAALAAADPDVVLHLAAQSVVRESYRIPRETFEINAIGTASVLDAVRARDRPCVVVCVTSDKCYLNVEQPWGYRETDALGDLSPYGGSKGAAELVIRSYRHAYFRPDRLHEHGVKVASARAGNVVGGGDFTPDALIVDVVKALAAGEPAGIRSPGAVRPWQHVLTCLSGYLTLAAALLESEDPNLCEAWNFGPLPGDQLPVHGVVDRFIREWGSGSWRDDSAGDHPHEADLLRLSVDKAVGRLGWRPRWEIDRVLSETARWYRRWLDDPGSMRAFGLEQIAAYERALEGGPPAGRPPRPATAHSGTAAPIEAGR
ncbi:MAG TPA: CDP-glucose 4,6-dehydratase [Gemmatimonadota bacterium]|nr:CDP-glucose 4,6-dehydratase [Gemmatimonadota bacterium]